MSWYSNWRGQQVNLCLLNSQNGWGWRSPGPTPQWTIFWWFVVPGLIPEQTSSRCSVKADAVKSHPCGLSWIQWGMEPPASQVFVPPLTFRQPFPYWGGPRGFLHCSRKQGCSLTDICILNSSLVATRRAQVFPTAVLPATRPMGSSSWGPRDFKGLVWLVTWVS